MPIGCITTGGRPLPTRFPRPASLVCLCAIAALSGGCCRPIIIDDGLLAIGCYEHRRWEISDHSHATETEGIGVLVTPGGFTLGYTRVASVFSSNPDDDIAVRFGRAEFYLGEEASQEAERMAHQAMPRADQSEGDEQ